MTAVEWLQEQQKELLNQVKSGEFKIEDFEYYNALYIEQAKAMEKEQKGYSKEDVREMLFMALNEPKETCCTTHTQDSIVRKVLSTFKSE